MAEENGNGKVPGLLPILAAVATILAVLGGFGFAIIQPIADGEKQNEAKIETIRTQYLTLREHAEYKESSKDKVDKLQADLLRLISDTRDGLAEFRKEIGAAHTLGDKFNDVEREIAEIRRSGTAPIPRMP